ncbi:MAG: M60 family metallopeptidase [Clostridia bacterium]|nr:M60 family metallopeptidase [Clostridia bacterium]
MKLGKKLTAILSCALATVFTFGVAGCGKGDSGDNGGGSTPVDPGHYNYDRFDDDANFVKVGIDDSDWDGVKATEVNGGYEKGTAIATQKSEYIRTLSKSEIVKPVVGVVDEHATYGVKEYPAYGKVLKGYTAEERDGLIRESRALSPTPTWKSLGIYDAIDSEGYLLKNGQRVLYSTNVGSGGNDEEGEGDVISGGNEEEGNNTPAEEGSTSVNKQYNEEYRKLYKHTAALTHFGGGLSDDEPRIVKTITAYTHTKLLSTQITGLYAPAGEVIKIEMSQSDYRAAGGIKVLIGQNYNLGQHVSMETSGNGIKGTGLNRMPDILSIFLINDSTVKDNKADTVTAYVGSFFGGPIYFSPVNINATQNISVTISGGVRYQNFILGSTTPEEYELDKASTAPYFDLEVYDSVRFTTTKHTSSGGLALKDFTYENCTDAAVLWDKIAEVSTRVAANGLSASSAPVYIIGDCYIAAGAAFANPGRNGVVCPPSWLAEALNYNKFVNGGSWGTMHEYNHCWQGYGFGNGGEVSNNATTLVSYSLYTRISQSRNMTITSGLSGWGRYSDPAWAMCLALPTSAAGNKIFDLSAYATLLHNIGQDNFVAAARGGREAGSTIYYNNLVNATHYDMTYYFTDFLNYGIGETLGGEGNPGKIGNIEKSAVDAVKEKNYPMFVPVSSVYQVGRSIIRDNQKEYITTAQPFSYGSGEFTMDFNNRNGNGSYSNKNLVIPDGFTAKVVSVTQPQNGKVEMLENNLVKYTPKNGADGLYSGNFRVKLRITKDDGAFIVEDVDLVINLKQSSDTNLNRTTYVYDNEADVPATNAIYNASTKTFDFGNYSSTETNKNVCTQETNTQIWQAGWNYDDDKYDANSKNYRVMPNNKTLQTMEGAMYLSAANTYRFTLKGRGKATLYLSYDNGATWESALTINRTSGNAYNANEYSEHKFTTAKNYVHFKVVLLVTKENDFFGVGVASKQADGTFAAFTNASAITNASVELDKMVRDDSSKKFETEYHFQNEYNYSYTSENKVWASGNKLVSVSHNPWDASQPITNMFDGNVNTYYHSEKNVFITEDKPFELVVDLGAECTVNRVYFNGYKGSVGNNGMVKNFKIYGSTDGKNFDTLVTEVTDSPANAKNMSFNFDPVKIRYYKLVVTKTDNGRYFAMCSIVFSNYISYSKGILVSPSDFCVRYDGNWNTTDKLSNFGIVYQANAGASVEYHFTGTRVAYFANKSADYGTVDIYLDGKLVAGNVDLSSSGNAGYDSAVFDRYNIKVSECSLAYMYTGDALANGDHVIKIVGKSGKFNVDSFAYWN